MVTGVLTVLRLCRSATPGRNKMPEHAVSNSKESGNVVPSGLCTCTWMVQYGCSVGLSVHSCPSGMFLPLTGISLRSDDMSSSVVKAFVVVVVVAVFPLGEAPTDWCCRAS
eukprot:scaffold4223_cov189-Amphora_coffeaeformis.AAC.40